MFCRSYEQLSTGSISVKHGVKAWSLCMQLFDQFIHNALLECSPLDEVLLQL